MPWYIYHYDNEILSLAGLFSQWVESASGEVYNTFSIVTTDANDIMAEIHNSGKRMPAVLTKDAEAIWINSETEPSAAHTLLKPASSDILKAHTISPLINDRNSNRNTPGLIRPHSYTKQNLLF